MFSFYLVQVRVIKKFRLSKWVQTLKNQITGANTLRLSEEFPLNISTWQFRVIQFYDTFYRDTYSKPRWSYIVIKEICILVIHPNIFIVIHKGNFFSRKFANNVNRSDTICNSILEFWVIPEFIVLWCGINLV